MTRPRFEVGQIIRDYGREFFAKHPCVPQVNKTFAALAVEFLHLFSLHILPPAFVRIRHYGLLSPCNRDKVRSVQVRKGGKPIPKERRKPSYITLCEQKGWEIGICPHCKCRMQVIEILEPSRAPPESVSTSRTAHL